MILNKTAAKPVIYQLMPRWFTNITDGCVANGTIEENGCGKLNDITARVLKSIKSLGATHVWYTGVIRHATKTDFSAFGIPRNHPGIVKGEAGSPYAICDYYDIDPALATDVNCRMDEFQALVARTHQVGMKVILDFVPNHVAREYKSICKPANVADLGENDDQTKAFARNNNFYYLPGNDFAPRFDCRGYAETPARATGNDCFSPSPAIGDWYETVKINYGVDPADGGTHFRPVPDTWNKMFHILRFWAAKGVDGFRCDMAHMVPVEFWHWAIRQIKQDFPKVVFIAEIYDTNLYRSYIDTGGFDYLYDKVTLYDSLIKILKHNESTQTITSCWQTVDDIRGHMLNFLENHDEQRIASPQLVGDPFAAVPALVVSALISTCPFMVYAGQELGERATDSEGFSGNDGRTSIFDYWSVPTLREWNQKTRLSTPHPVRDHYRKVLNICNSEAAVARGQMFDLMYVNTGLHRQYAFVRYYEGELLVIVANFAPDEVTLDLNLPGHLFDYLRIKPAVYQGEELLHKKRHRFRLEPDTSLSVGIPGHDAIIWKFHVDDAD